MPGDEVYELYVDALTPMSISMARLAEYMTDFAELLGHQEHVHFEASLAGVSGRTYRPEQGAVPGARSPVR